MLDQTREIAETYLGNLTKDANLAQRVETAYTLNNCLETYLSQTDSGKGRILAESTSGTIVGIIKSRDWSICEGDVFITKSGKLLLIHLQEERLMVLSFSEPVENHAIELVHLGHVLGNHHWPIIIKKNRIYVQLIVDSGIIEATIAKFQIPGLKIDYELRSPQEHFQFSQHSHHS
ncbi:MAG: urease accessory protein UreE [Trichodesmium sp. St15_bin1_1]|jgi:urease accessory protein|nr:urease accessory protein UreE [Trichodesmium sp. St18_bin1]MDE5114328.1 urease accessory protein UreE [Trichodesmium sp. St15_bin1_1]MDE5120865.1 urease accessory protein UreE [Trichodesmium sp. St19_bin1]